MRTTDGLTVLLFCGVLLGFPVAVSSQTADDQPPEPAGESALPETLPANETQPGALSPERNSEGETDGIAAPGVSVPLELPVLTGESETSKPDAGSDSGTDPAAPVDAAADGKKGLGTFLKKMLGTEEGSPEDAPENPDASGLEIFGSEENQDETQGKIAQLKRLAIRNFEQKRSAEAVRYLNDLITLKPYSPEYHLALALTYRRDSRFKDALQKYQEVLELGGPKAIVALLKAEVYAAENMKDKAYEMLKEAALGGRNVINDVHNIPLLKPFETDTEFIKLALQLEKFKVNIRGQDPFTNPFPSGTDAEDRGPVSPDVVWPPERQQKLLREIKRVHERIQLYIEAQDEKKAMAAYLKLKEYLGNQRYLTVPRIKTEFLNYSQLLPEIEVQISGIRLKYYYGKAIEKIKAMKDVFNDGDYQRVMTIHSQIENLAQEMVNANPRYGGVANQIMKNARHIVDRAKIRLEFESKKPNIQGIIIAGDSKVTIINDRVVKQGESLSGFRVVNVESNRVTFKYKGEEIPLIFRRY